MLKQSFKYCNSVNFISLRFRSFKVKQKWASEEAKKEPRRLALEHFDFFYKPHFKRQWPSIRLGFLSDPKYCALVNSYANTENVTASLREIGTFEIFERLQQAKSVQKAKQRMFLTDVNDPVVRSSNAEVHGVRYAGDDTSHFVESISQSISNGALQNEEAATRTDETSLHDFVPVEKKLTVEDFLPKRTRTGTDGGREQEFWSMKYDNLNSKLDVVKLPESPVYPTHLKAMTFSRGDISTFPQSPPDKTGVVGYYLMDAASLFPVLALALNHGDRVLDLCAAPGGKSLAMLQTLLPGVLVCNEADPGRMRRLRQTLEAYLPDSADIRDRIILKLKDAEKWDEFDRYDKVLVDVPCTNDRHSLTYDDETQDRKKEERRLGLGNIFRRSRTEERLKLPDLQTRLLVNGIRSLLPGGCLVYATCSLSPLQNDNVVQRAMQDVLESSRTSHVDLVVKDLSEMASDFESIGVFKFHRNCQYGQLIVPNIMSNFGPMYVCKLQRVK